MDAAGKVGVKALGQAHSDDVPLRDDRVAHMVG